MGNAEVRHCLAVIGGSGVYDLDGLEQREVVVCETPYGAPSGPVIRGMLGPTELLFLARHGQEHQLPPHEVNYRANVCALKQLGATHLLSVSAVGSMRQSIAPGQVVVPDQFIDLTKRRVSTYFDDGIVAHVALGDPTCAELSSTAARAARSAGLVVHEQGTYVCIEGPQFSTRAESELYRSWNVDIIGMTAMPEAKLAREAELPYALLAFVTDYDCWHQSEEQVSVDAIVTVLKQNAARARECVRLVAESLPDPTRSRAYRALDNAVITRAGAASEARRKRLSWLSRGRF